MKNVLKKFGNGFKTVSKKTKIAVSSAFAVMSTVAFGLVASAEESGTTSSTVDLSDAMETALDSLLSQTMEMLATVLPIAISVLTAGVVISYGIKMFKKISGQRG